MNQQINIPSKCDCTDCKVVALAKTIQPSIDGEELSDVEINFIRLWRQGKVG